MVQWFPMHIFAVPTSPLFILIAFYYTLRQLQLYIYTFFEYQKEIYVHDSIVSKPESKIHLLKKKSPQIQTEKLQVETRLA